MAGVKVEFRSILSLKISWFLNSLNKQLYQFRETKNNLGLEVNVAVLEGLLIIEFEIGEVFLFKGLELMDYDSEDVSAIGTLEQVNFGVDIIPVGLEICNEIKRVHGYFLGFGEGGLRVVN